MTVLDLQKLDVQHSWHPCAQMKDYETLKPLVVESASGSYIRCEGGQRLIDATSSWWCKSLGHAHPQLKAALLQQVDKFEHVMFANTTHDAVAQLSARLAKLMPGLDKVFYAGDGACAVEIAMKMSVHYRHLKGDAKKSKFVALKNGYHGETSGALSVSSASWLDSSPYASMLFDPIVIEPLYVSGCSDPQWLDAAAHWKKVEAQLLSQKDAITAIIVEPIVQAAGGMKIISQDFLQRLAQFAKTNDIHLIADEIMTGLGRTGKMLACEYAKISPDFVCLGKGLTAGWMPFSAVLTSGTVYQAFYADHDSGKAFLHSHTYSGNALGASVALAALDVIAQEGLCERAHRLQALMRTHLLSIAEQTGLIDNVRGIGAMVAADIVSQADRPRPGHAFFQKAIEHGALMRPIGDTIYWVPPLNIGEETLAELAEITKKTLLAIG